MGFLPSEIPAEETERPPRETQLPPAARHTASSWVILELISKTIHRGEREKRGGKKIKLPGWRDFDLRHFFPQNFDTNRTSVPTSAHRYLVCPQQRICVFKETNNKGADSGLNLWREGPWGPGCINLCLQHLVLRSFKQQLRPQGQTIYRAAVTPWHFHKSPLPSPISAGKLEVSFSTNAK